jgi:hypothetical protein
MKQIGRLYFKRVYELKVGTRYMIEESTYFYLKIYVATHASTKWTNITYVSITDLPETYNASNELTMSFMLSNNVYYEMVPMAPMVQNAMEQRALHLILKRIDENFI